MSSKIQQIQILDDKPMDPQVVLEKVMRLDRKHTNFDFYDNSRKIQNPQILNDMPPNQHLLRNFWKQMHNHYFRIPQQYQIDRAHIMQQYNNKDDYPFTAKQEFWNSMQSVFTPQYIKKQTSTHKKQIDSQNWLCSLYLNYVILQNHQQKSIKKIKKQLEQLNYAKSKIQNINNRRFQHSLIQQNQQLKKLIPKHHNQQNQVELQIKQLQNQLFLNHSRTKYIFQSLKQKIHIQQNQGNTLFFYSQTEHIIQRSKNSSQQQIINKKINQAALQLNYYAYTIHDLQRKQVAQSISKVIKHQKSKNQSNFLVTFQKGMNLKSKQFSQSQFLQLNKYRQYSLLKFYNTSLKSPYSFICQNYIGFKQIYLNRNQPCKYKNKSIIDQMKKNNQQVLQVKKGFQNFDICHHCKLLYPQNFLVKCKYSSQKQGIPSQPVSYCDPYLTQISKIDSTTNIKFQNRKRNCFQNYTYSNGQYFCDRKFCKFCIKQTYGGSFDKNGLCPFCQGICFCTRCTRNQMIARLKSLYLFLGGRISEVQTQGFHSFKTQNQIQNQQQTKKKGRPKKSIKKPIGNLPLKSLDHINNIRVQLQPLRLLSDLVKKRQKNKIKLLQTQQYIFLQKINLISQNFSQNSFKNYDQIDLQTSQKQNKDKNKIKIKNQRGRPRKD